MERGRWSEEAGDGSICIYKAKLSKGGWKRVK